ncbi:MAG: protein-disulfide reductase DsbD domain-containing protein, partial [Planctomycetota bacterium]
RRWAMARFCTRLLRLSMLLSGPLLCLQAERVPQAKETVGVQLLSDAVPIAPGKPFYVGLLLSIDKGWHVYWRNPGDAGQEVRLKWQLPDGFHAEGLEWPLPERYQEPGDIITYGYHGEVLLAARIIPPAELKATDSVEIGVQASWLVCSKEICVPGSTEKQLSLKVANQPHSSRHAPLFRKWRRQVPVEDPRQAGIQVEQQWHGDGKGGGKWAIRWQLSLGHTLEGGTKQVRFFPYPLSGARFQPTGFTLSREGREVAAEVFVEKIGKGFDPNQLQAVIAYPEKAMKKEDSAGPKTCAFVVRAR